MRVRVSAGAGFAAAVESAGLTAAASGFEAQLEKQVSSVNNRKSESNIEKVETAGYFFIRNGKSDDRRKGIANKGSYKGKPKKKDQQ